MRRKITCTNDENVSLCFTSDFSPFLLQECDGIYGVENDVITKDNTMIDGASYYGSTVKMRNIVLTLADRTPHMDNRNTLYKLFKPKARGVFKYEEDEEVREIGYYVESIEITSMNEIRIATVSLLCPDPFFYDLSDITVVMTGWDGQWEFLHEFKEEGEEFGVRRKEQMKTFNNDAAGDNIGITATFTAEDDVTNIILNHIESNTYMGIGTTDKPLHLVYGDKVIVTTQTNNKNVVLVRDGIVTNINEYLDENSTFIQLTQGLNTLRYAAESGVEFLNVDISFRYRYLGV